MASLSANAPSGGGDGAAVTELDYNKYSDSPTKQEYPGNEAFVALVKAHGAILRKIDLRCVWAGP